MSELLELEELTVSYRTAEGPLPAVRGVDLVVRAGEVVGVALQAVRLVMDLGEARAALDLFGRQGRLGLVEGLVGGQRQVEAPEALVDLRHGPERVGPGIGVVGLVGEREGAFADR